MDILGTSECLVSTVELAEACGRNIVKLSYSIDPFCKSQLLASVTSVLSVQNSHNLDLDGEEVFDRSFDFSKFQNLLEVSLGLPWVRGGLRWIPVALSTTNPITSPHLSIIRLNLSGPPTIVRITNIWIGGLGNELRRTTDEVTRIKNKFDEGIEFVLSEDQWFRVFLDSFDLRL